MIISCLQDCVVEGLVLILHQVRNVRPRHLSEFVQHAPHLMQHERVRIVVAFARYKAAEALAPTYSLHFRVLGFIGAEF